MEQRKKFFADFHKITKEFCENQQKKMELCKNQLPIEK
jgi:hypothetical protein